MAEQIPTARQRPDDNAVSVYGVTGEIPTSAVAQSIERMLPLVHMTDFHDDGSQTETYFLELTAEQYVMLARMCARPPRNHVLVVKPEPGAGWTVREVPKDDL